MTLLARISSMWNMLLHRQSQERVLDEHVATLQNAIKSVDESTKRFDEAVKAREYSDPFGELASAARQSRFDREDG